MNCRDYVRTRRLSTHGPSNHSSFPSERVQPARSDLPARFGFHPTPNDEVYSMAMTDHTRLFVGRSSSWCLSAEGTGTLLTTKRFEPMRIADSPAGSLPKRRSAAPSPTCRRAIRSAAEVGCSRSSAVDARYRSNRQRTDSPTSDLGRVSIKRPEAIALAASALKRTGCSTTKPVRSS